MIVTGEACTDTSDCYDIVISGLESREDHWFRIYPDPAGSTVTLDFSERIPESFIVPDMTGQKIQAESEVTAEKYEWNISHLAQGIYLIKVRFDNQTKVIRFVEE